MSRASVTRTERLAFLAGAAIFGPMFAALGAWVTVWVYLRWDSVGVFWLFWLSGIGGAVGRQLRAKEVGDATVDEDALHIWDGEDD